MFYLIMGIMLVLFYIFMAPQTIKGTLNLVAAVFLLVALVVVLLLGVTKLVEAPMDLWLILVMVLVGLWSMYDLYHLDREKTRQPKRRPYRYRS